MRKLAPAVILTSILALSSGAAFAFGDMNKTKKTTAADTASSQAVPTASDATSKPTDPAQPHPAMPSATNSTAATGSVAATSGSTTMSEACKGLTPRDAAWKANDCSAAGKRSDSLGGAGTAGPAGSSSGSSAGSSSGPGR